MHCYTSVHPNQFNCGMARETALIEITTQGILNESAVPSGISDPAVNPAIDQPQVPATNVAVSSLPHLQLCPRGHISKMLAVTVIKNTVNKRLWNFQIRFLHYSNAFE